MRTLLLFVLLAAIAVAAALFARANTGYVLLVSPPWRVELSMNGFMLLVVAAFALFYAVVRFVSRVTGMPDEVREHRRQANLERARAKQDAALVALLEGRYGRARQAAEEALAIPRSSGLPALIGARAALEMRDFDGVEALLARPDAQVQSLAVPRLMLEAELALERGRTADALARLSELKRDAGLHTAALRLELRTLNQAGRHTEVPALIDQLARRKVYGAADAELLRASAHARSLADLAHDANGLRSYWKGLSDAERTRAQVARAAAQSYRAVGLEREAAEILVKSLERGWSSDLAALYADCRLPDGPRQLEVAERWLIQHSQDATLLHALGRLCERERLWGKAQTYYEAALALDPGWRNHVALGELNAALGRRDAANAHLAAALDLTLAELGGRAARPLR